jgi:hypothetical protein
MSAVGGWLGLVLGFLLAVFLAFGVAVAAGGAAEASAMLCSLNEINVLESSRILLQMRLENNQTAFSNVCIKRSNRPVNGGSNYFGCFLRGAKRRFFERHYLQSLVS